MESKRVMCPHSDGWFFPEKGVPLDDCPKCGRAVEVPPDNIADASKKVQPARCPHCGGKGHTDHDEDVPCAVCQPAPAPLPGSEELAEALAEISAAGLGAVAEGLRLHISDLTRRLAEAEAHADGFEQMQADDAACAARYLNECIALRARLAEAEAENGRFADMLESSVADWRKLYTEERAERVRIEGILLNDVQGERQESDEHIKGLVTVIKTQDKAIRDFKARTLELEATIDAMTEAHAHDDMALTAAYLNGAHAGKKQVEAERDALRERCEKLEWLVEVQDFVVYFDPTSTLDSACVELAASWKYAELQAALAATEVKP